MELDNSGGLTGEFDDRRYKILDSSLYNVALIKGILYPTGWVPSKDEEPEEDEEPTAESSTEDEEKVVSDEPVTVDEEIADAVITAYEKRHFQTSFSNQHDPGREGPGGKVLLGYTGKAAINKRYRKCTVADKFDNLCGLGRWGVIEAGTPVWNKPGEFYVDKIPADKKNYNYRGGIEGQGCKGCEKACECSIAEREQGAENVFHSPLLYPRICFETLSTLPLDDFDRDYLGPNTTARELASFIKKGRSASDPRIKGLWMHFPRDDQTYTTYWNNGVLDKLIIANFERPHYTGAIGLLKKKYPE